MVVFYETVVHPDESSSPRARNAEANQDQMEEHLPPLLTIDDLGDNPWGKCGVGCPAAFYSRHFMTAPLLEIKEHGKKTL